MLAKNSNSGQIPNDAKSAKPHNPNPTPRVAIKSRSTTKKSIIDVSNISVSIRSSNKKAKEISSKAKNVQIAPDEAAVTQSEIGVQVDEVEIIANDCTRNEEAGGDADPIIYRLPSAKVIREIERGRQQKKDNLIKERLSETRKFEPHAAKQEIHITNLKEFLDTGTVTRRGESEAGPEVKYEDQSKANVDKTKNAVGAYDRIKRKEEELMKLFNSI